MRKLIVNNEEKVLETLMMFKKGILPEWEDKINSQGGSLVLEIKHLENDE